MQFCLFLIGILSLSVVDVSCFSVQPTWLKKRSLKVVGGHAVATVHSNQQTKLHMFADPSQFVDQQTFLEQLSSTATQTFTSSLESRILGTIVGNIAAGVAFKILADFVSASFQSKVQNLTNPADEQKTTSVFAPLRKKQSISDPIVENSERKSTSFVPQISSTAWAKLVLCILIDAVSDASFVLPGIGELEDIAWAPLSALVLKYLFESNAVATAEFVKEILPFTDIIPFACTVWLLENVFVDSPFAKLLQLRRPNSDSDKKI